jgi:hypothetical protein
LEFACRVSESHKKENADLFKILFLRT